MGVTYVKAKVKGSSKSRKSKEFKFLVDSGAVYTVMPADDLKALGIAKTSTREFLLANGERVEWDVGNALFEYKGNIGAAPVIFGRKGIYLLGMTTLESLGMMLDPIERELKPLPMLLMRSEWGSATKRR